MLKTVAPWFTVVILAAAVLWNREAVRFAINNVPGLLGAGEFGVLQERRLGLEGARLLGEGRPKEAIGALEASLAIDPRGEYRRELALALFQQGNGARAEQELRRHLDSFPKDSFALLSLALIAERRGLEPDEVRAILGRAESAIQAELGDIERPATAFPAAEAEKHKRVLAELQRLRGEIKRERTRFEP